MLTTWDGLDAATAAQAAGCNRAAFHVRLHRARRRLRDQLTAESKPETTSQSRAREAT